jgi:hypothetical protein
MTAIDAEARAVIRAFVDGKIDHHWMFDWYQDNPHERQYDGFDPFLIFMDVDDGLTTLKKERARLAELLPATPGTAIWHEDNDWDERGQR